MHKKSCTPMLSKEQRRQQVRPVLATQKYRLDIQAHKYRLQRYAELIKLGVKESVADQALEIWQNGVQSKEDIKLLDKVADFLERRLNPRTLVRFPVRKAA